MPAGSWGGIVRNGPGQSYAKVGSLQEGDPVTLVEKTEVFENGFPWFKIAYSGGGSGYQWGGILCAIGEARPELFQTCTTKAQRDEARETAPQRCRDNGGEWGEGQCWPKGHYSSKTKKNTTGLVLQGAESTLQPHGHGCRLQALHRLVHRPRRQLGTVTAAARMRAPPVLGKPQRAAVVFLALRSFLAILPSRFLAFSALRCLA